MANTEGDERVTRFIQAMGFSAVAATTDGRSVSMTDLRTDIAAALAEDDDITLTRLRETLGSPHTAA